MLVDVKNLETDEFEHIALEVSDIMLGAYEGDDRYIVFLPGESEPLIFTPMQKYIISDHQVEP